MRYRYYNPTSATWSEELYSLDDLANNAFFNDDTMLVTEDGQQTLTYKQAMQNYVGWGNYPQPIPKVPTTHSDKDHKYTNYWIREACRYVVFLVTACIICPICAGGLLIVEVSSLGIIAGLFLGVMLAFYSVWRVDAAAKKQADS